MKIYEFYISFEKYEFFIEEINFLEFIISFINISMEFN